MRLSTPRPPAVAAARALAGDDQHDLAAARLLCPQEAEQRVMRLGLGHAVQIEPAVDRMRAARDALLGLAGQATRAAAARRASAARRALRRHRRGLGTRPWRGRSRRGQVVVGLGLRNLPQRRDRTGDALPQDALVVAQPPPAHAGGSCLALGFDVPLGVRFAGRFGRALGLLGGLLVVGGFFSRLLDGLRRRLGGFVAGLLGRGSLAALLFVLNSALSVFGSRSAWPPSFRRPPSLRGSAAAGAAESRRRATGTSSFGASMTKRPSWRSRPAMLAASSPAPK